MNLTELTERYLQNCLVWIEKNKLSGTIRKGIFDGFVRTYSPAAEFGPFPPADNGMITGYEAALNIYVHLTLGEFDKAKTLIEKVIGLIKWEESMGFEGMTHHIYFTLNDEYVNPRGTMDKLLWVNQTNNEHFCTGAYADSRINYSVAIDNNTWVENSSLAQMKKSIDYVKKEFLIEKDVNGKKRKGAFFLKGNYTDRYVPKIDSPKLLESEIHFEGTFGYVIKLHQYTDLTDSEAEKKRYLALADNIFTDLVEMQEELSYSGYGTPYNTENVLGYVIHPLVKLDAGCSTLTEQSPQRWFWKD